MRINISNFFMWLSVTLSFLSYDSIIYSKYYNIFTALVLLSGILSILFSFRTTSLNYIKALKNNKLVVFLLFSLVTSSFFSSIIIGNIGYSDLVSSVTTGISLIIFFLWIPIQLKDYRVFYKYILFLISISSIIAIFMTNFNITFGHVQSEPSRMASIFFDANYYGSMCSIAVILTIFVVDNKLLKGILLAINILALYYSNSRGATLALVAAIMLYFLFIKKKNIKTLFAFLLLCLGLLVVLIFLEENNFFRIYQGLNSRDFLWEIAIGLIYEHPFVGYGKSSIDFLLKSAGALNGSTHNSLLDFTLSYGVINLVIYLLIVIKSIFRGIKNSNRQLLLLVFFFIVNSNSINISIGGVGFNSLIFTITIGLINYRIIKENILSEEGIYET